VTVVVVDGLEAVQVDVEEDGVMDRLEVPVQSLGEDSSGRQAGEVVVVGPVAEQPLGARLLADRVGEAGKGKGDGDRRTARVRGRVRCCPANRG
jgi:hypothetical protein